MCIYIYIVYSSGSSATGPNLHTGAMLSSRGVFGRNKAGRDAGEGGVDPSPIAPNESNSCRSVEAAGVSFLKGPPRMYFGVPSVCPCKTHSKKATLRKRHMGMGQHFDS